MRRSVGTFTFCFTDIEGSTVLLRTLGQADYGELLSRHRQILRESWRAHGGREIDMEGDAFLVVFDRGSDAVRAAADAQRALARAVWPAGVELRVRMGLHTGEATEREGKYVGLAVHRGARIASAAHGGQVLVSRATRDVVADEDLAGLAFRDLGEHRLKDLTAAERIYELSGADLPSDFPPPRTLDPHRTNLPVQPTPFLGRERELGDLTALLLASETRLLTLVGAGGSGKTRLALQLAAELLEEFPDGVYVAFLAPVTDPALVLPSLGRALGLREGPGRSMEELLSENLAGRRLLLVADNLEHLLDSAVDISRLLRSTTTFKLVATSRAPLRIAGEREYAVAPLTEEEGQALFVARAQMVRADFEPDAAADTIAAICRRLDQLPLAIELAAARVRSFTPDTLLSRLSSSLSLLTSGTRDAEERQQTLRATIDWSYCLLNDDERRSFRHLGVFRGGFTLPAAEAICDPDEELRTPVLDALDRLVENSLVRASEADAGETRFFLLETIREFAADALEAADELHATGERHARWYFSLAHTLSADEQDGHARLRADHENLRTALRWLIDAADARRSFLLFDRLSWYWDAEGQNEEGHRWGTLVLALRSDGLAAERARALAADAHFECRRGNYDAASAGIEAARELAASSDDDAALLAVEGAAGVIEWARGDLRAAARVFRRALLLAQKVGDVEIEGVERANLGKVLIESGEWQEAEEVLADAVAWSALAGLERARAWCLSNAALLALEQGKEEQARTHLRGALEIHARVLNAFELLQSIEIAARLRADGGDALGAARLWGAQETLRAEFQTRQTPTERRRLEGHIAVARVSVGEEAFDNAWSEGRAMTAEAAIRCALEATHERVV